MTGFGGSGWVKLEEVRRTNFDSIGVTEVCEDHFDIEKTAVLICVGCVSVATRRLIRSYNRC